MATLGYIAPQTVEQGSVDEPFSIKGSGLLGSTSVSFSGTGIAVTGLQVPDDETLNFDVSVARNATIGVRDVSVTLANASVVTLAGSVAVTNFQPLLSQLRGLIGERIKPNQSDTDTFFTDDELTNIIIRHSANLYLAASECWASKAADRADLHDMTESGSERPLSQLFKNALAMQKMYADQGAKIAQTLVTPAVAQVASILGPGLGRPTAASSKPVVDPVFDPIFNDPFLFLNAVRLWPMLDMINAGAMSWA